MHFLEGICIRFALSIYVGALMFEAISLPVAVYLLPNPIAVAFLALQVVMLVLPLGGETPDWAARLNNYALQEYAKWCNFCLTYEDEKGTFLEGKSYVIGYEPHSVLPMGIPLVFSDCSPRRANLKTVNTLATSVVDWCPLVRHLFYWLGGRPASRNSMHALLDAGSSVALIPGGVAECAYMSPGKEVVYLKSRKGFVRIALQHGAALVPVYCFGQNDVYKFIRLGPPLVPQWLVDNFVRTILFCPMLIYGVYGTPLPHRAHLHMVIGAPIPVPLIATPSHEEIQHYLDRFIGAMQQLHDKHKAAAGFPNSRLVIM